MEVLTVDRTFEKRRLQQTVRSELARMDVRAIVREVVREALDELHDDSSEHVPQRRPTLKVVRK